MAGPAKLLPMVRDGAPVGGDQSEVLDAALQAFLDFGIKRTSMAEVARRGRVSLATLYRRFAGKSELVLAVFLAQAREFLDRADAAVRPLVESGAPAPDQIVELFVAFTAGLRENRLLDRIIETDAETVLPYLTVHGSGVIETGRDYLAEFIFRLQREGKLPAYDPLPVAEMVARTSLSFVLTKPTLVPLDDEAAARRFARDHIVPSFRPFAV
ncbi:TetR/AcrR family transcriptional regulator [Nocardia stercoris]|uniref:TetR/AcrR family transcriptional regulator n=1 Tax=Nocardia stercoris TaxID=2483361 RepID=A0A3M2L311_9NOCA|nr:TetR/AcrR family transcriptional regulator [Nocardia stercoris]RMI31366.1 TetR/AcrR family transcriptional regulator [Nocardia stercoris]